MKRLVIVAEGDAEESFVNSILSPYFASLGLYNSIQCFKIKNSNGGVSKYSDVKRDLINTLYENDVIVSTMLDFYRLPSSFPGKREAATLPTHQQQVEYIEEQLKNDIESTQECRFDNFIPYIQLHEFEALVFSSIQGIDVLFEPTEFHRKELMKVIEDFPNPEDINDQPDTVPSVRLMKLIPGYEKVLYGIDILHQHGMLTLLDRCPHFCAWITKLESALRRQDL